jgi:hypothetical protein
VLGEWPLLLLLPALLPPLPPAKCTKCCARLCRCCVRAVPPGISPTWPKLLLPAAAAALSTLMCSPRGCTGVRGALLKLADRPTWLLPPDKPAPAATAAISELLLPTAAAAAWLACPLAAAAMRALVLLATRLGTALKALRVRSRQQMHKRCQQATSFTRSDANPAEPHKGWQQLTLQACKCRAAARARRYVMGCKMHLDAL